MPHLSLNQANGAYLLLAVFFVALNAFFVAAEFAIVKIRATRLKVLSKKGNYLATIAKKMVDHLDAYLSATQLGITLASLGLGWIGEPAFAGLLMPLFHRFGEHLSSTTIHSISFTVAFLVISALHIILGELVPKSLAIRSAERICLLVAIPMRIFYISFFPFLWILNGSANFFLKLIHFPKASGSGRAHTEEELKLIVEDSFQEGTIGAGKRVLLDKAMDFSHKKVKDIMIPADKMDCFYLDRSIHENLDRARASAHSRFPLLEKKGGKVLGFIHMKDVIWCLENNDIINLFDLKRPILFFNDDLFLDLALREFQNKKIHAAMIQRREGKPLGLITLEDVIEELVGDIEDEFDKARA